MVAQSERSFAEAKRAHASGAGPETVALHWRQGLAALRTGLENGGRLHPMEHWSAFLASVALSDGVLSHFLSSLNERSWEPTGSEWGWCVAQVRVAYSLFRRQGALRSLEELRALVLDTPLAEEFLERTERIQGTHRLLDALDRGDADVFNRELKPLIVGCLDVGALGLCRLAKGRSMPISVRHPNLPLQILDLPQEE